MCILFAIIEMKTICYAIYNVYFKHSSSSVSEALVLTLFLNKYSEKNSKLVKFSGTRVDYEIKIIFSCHYLGPV